MVLDTLRFYGLFFTHQTPSNWLRVHSNIIRGHSHEFWICLNQLLNGLQQVGLVEAALDNVRIRTDLDATGFIFRRSLMR